MAVHWSCLRDFLVIPSKPLTFDLLVTLELFLRRTCEFAMYFQNAAYRPGLVMRCECERAIDRWFFGFFFKEKKRCDAMRSFSLFASHSHFRVFASHQNKTCLAVGPDHRHFPRKTSNCHQIAVPDYRYSLMHTCLQKKSAIERCKCENAN
jgi:hypothetical protein